MQVSTIVLLGQGQDVLLVDGRGLAGVGVLDLFTRVSCAQWEECEDSEAYIVAGTVFGTEVLRLRENFLDDASRLGSVGVRALMSVRKIGKRGKGRGVKTYRRRACSEQLGLRST